MKFLILVTDREIRGAFFCLGIFFDMEQFVKIYSGEFDEKMFFVFCLF